MISNALVFSDLHLGWAVCAPGHRELLAALPAAADDAELIILNGDIIDAYRLTYGDHVSRLAALCDAWRREGRTVVVIEGNHDPSPHPLGDPPWHYNFDTPDGRVLVLHGHRFSEVARPPGSYEHYGKHVLIAENALYTRARPLRRLYPHSFGWFVGAWGVAEDRLWRPPFPGKVAPLLDGFDVLVHGHFHFGPARTTIAGRPAWRSGAWVSRGHLGSVDRMLRYRRGRWERIGLVSGRWRAIDDGR